ncbi:MAG: PAS domain-containing protein [Wolinella succinogenes]|uniref:PAS domain-containing protein n=1 Tax=Wolinella succinogenes TaxID=844 RepID=UPI0016A2F94E|nr:PAS domain-containing protein [Wolinella succinogenes]NLU35168.1 PAS domain-containing protein [Wolinella succinogenes]
MNRPIPNDHERVFEASEIVVSKTDTKGRITYGNDLFIELSGYKELELLGAHHNIVRHPDMPRVIFKFLWDYIKKGEEINAYVKNLSKDGSYYWVLANVTPSFDHKNQVVGYYSVRRKPKVEALGVIKPLYKQLLEIEKSQGMEGSERHLQEILNQQGKSYEEYILSL